MAKRQKSSVKKPINKTEEISSSEIRSLSTKLETWSKRLPAKERAILQVILDKANGREIGDTEGFSLQPSVSESTRNIFRSLLKGGSLHASAWVQLGEPWIQSVPPISWIQLGEPWFQATNTGFQVKGLPHSKVKGTEKTRQ